MRRLLNKKISTGNPKPKALKTLSRVFGASGFIIRLTFTSISGKIHIGRYSDLSYVSIEAPIKWSQQWKKREQEYMPV
jgi:hypothetical protein